MSSPQGTIAIKKNNIDIEKMSIPEKDKIDVVCRALQNTSKDIPLFMLAREAIQNEIDSIIMKNDQGPHECIVDPFHNNSDGSVLFAGTGIGFSEKVIAENFNSMFNSSKTNQLILQQDFDQCKGIGIKAAAYSEAVLHYKTKFGNEAFEFVFTQDDEGYPGLKKFELEDDDGDLYKASIVSLDPKNKNNFDFLNNKKSGTELIMTSMKGENLSEELGKSLYSLFGSNNKKLNDNYGWSFVRFLNMRYWSIPSNIKMKVVTDADGNRRESVLGAEHYLVDKSISKGIEEYEIELNSCSIGFKLHWFIMEEGMNNHSFIYTPFFAIKHRQELYGNLGPKQSRTSTLRSCGLSRASDRVVFIVEFDDGLISVPNNRKTITINGDEVDIAHVCEIISENLPKEIQKFKDDIVNSIPPEQLIGGTLRSFLKDNFPVKKSPNLHIVPTKPSPNPPVNSLTAIQSQNNNMGGQNSGSNINNPPAHRTRTRSSKRKAKAMIHKHKIPTIIEDTTLPKDTWANMNVKQWELSYNPDFQDIEELTKLTTLVESHSCQMARKNIVIGGLLTKSIEWIYQQSYKNIKEQDSKIQSILSDENLTKQAWLSSGDIAKQKKSESAK
jgi:hypothetical protein